MRRHTSQHAVSRLVALEVLLVHESEQASVPCIQPAHRACFACSSRHAASSLPLPRAVSLQKEVPSRDKAASREAALRVS
jgi:hypothetical protein